MLHIIGFIISGLIVGLIARALKPGDDSMSLGKTTMLGMAGALVVGWLGRMMGWYQADEGAGFLASTIGAIVVLSLYYAVAKNAHHTNHV
jgi:uncharacterized membrane protein YeaQ/YmgE (transglycosylase-associated protein family)